MKQNVKKYCEECMICQKNKSLALSRAGLLLPLEILNSGMISQWTSLRDYQKPMGLK